MGFSIKRYVVTQLFMLFLFSPKVFGQVKYGENWCFFQYQKLNFSSGAPAINGNSSLFGWGEGCATISDKNTGQLLFYTDGKTVYNRNDVVMQNGSNLAGDVSATQSSLIVPMPAESMKYYLFTTSEDAGGAFTGLAYSVVDMTLAGGLGAINAIKNVPLNDVAAEKLCGTQLCNGDYWVLCTNQYNNQFYAYKVTTLGISPAVISAAGTTNQFPRCAGQMKFSPNGKKIAKAYYHEYSNGIPGTFPVAELFDFDLATGQVLNAIALNIPNAIQGYGTEFSPNNNFVYFDGFSTDECINQFDISNFNSTAINNSRITVACGIAWSTSMQLGPDGKIYKVLPASLAAINNPNQAGINCNYVSYQLPLPGNSVYGLPNFVSSFLVPHTQIPPLNMPDLAVCKNDTILITAAPGFVNYNWSPDYNINTLTGTTVSAWPIVDTFYILTAINNEGCSITDTMLVHVNTAAPVYLGKDTNLCSYDHLLLDAGPGFTDYLWNTGEHIQSISVSSIGIFDVIATDSHGCKTKDSLEVLRIYDLPVINLQNDIDLCKGEHYILDVTTVNASYLWQDNSTAPVFTATDSGTYWVNVIVDGCKNADTINVSYKNCNCRLSIPNAITPNGDGINDKWVFAEGICYRQFDVFVYNRYGSLVYQKKDYKNDWQGTYKFKNLQDGTYYYIITAININGQQQQYKGGVTILR